MRKRVIAETDEGGRASYTGQVICDGPGQVALLLTEPYGVAGRIVEIPMDSIVEEVDLPLLDDRVARSALTPGS